MITRYTLLGLLFLMGFTTLRAQEIALTPPPKINWMTWEEMMAANAETPKKIFVDAYTDWCGWCKRMDATTFKNPNLVNYLNEHYYAVKLDAEMRDTVLFQDSAMVPSSARPRAPHQLAVWLLNGKMSYPTFVILDENYRNFGPIPGYKKPAELEPFLVFIGEGHYRSTDWNSFYTNFQPQFN